MRMTKKILNVFLCLLIVFACNVQALASKSDSVVFDSENMTVSYQNDSLEATEDGNVYLGL